MAPVTHGQSRCRRTGRAATAEYRAYTAMKNRCLNKRQSRYKDYGGRGITICSRWLDGEEGKSGFQCFFEDMGPKPSPQHSLDRLDNDQGYLPSNCRWATRNEQARNTRATSYVTVCDQIMTVAEAAEYFSSAPTAQVIRRRIHLGWRPEDAVLTPTGERPTPSFPVCF